MLVTMEAVPKGKGKLFSQPQPEETAQFRIGKYWEDDTEPNKFKVKLIPVEDRFYEEQYYSSDLIQLIKGGTVKIVAE